MANDAWLVVLGWAMLAAGGATALAIAGDLYTHPQRMSIMNIVWPVTGLYLPIAGWWLYRGIGRPMSVGEPTPVRRPYWIRVFVSATHCGAGCTIGDIIGIPIAAGFGWTLFGHRLFTDYVVEFGFAYVIGIAFQYLPIRTARQVSSREAIVDAVRADTLSLSAFEVGMFAWMALVFYVLLPAHPPEPSSVVFWLMMQVGMALGFLTTYPANWLLIRAGIKAGM
jgi:hypothetical protein